MQENTNCTVENLDSYLKHNLSAERYRHVISVAETTEMILKHYNCCDYLKEWNGISAGTFCGLAHDIARELEPEQWIDMCRQNNVSCSMYELSKPVLLHSYVSSIMIRNMYPDVPESWLRAIDLHTLGDCNMDDLALALYVADYVEPYRRYMTEERRNGYLKCQTIQLCAYNVLCDILDYQKNKGSGEPECSLRMKAFLEEKIKK